MAKCPFATWDEITGPSGDYTGGPFKIVHHTTEGSSYAGARAAFAANRSDPHFTVEGSKVFQHIDTAKAARALRNAPGGVETNRDSAVQIEVVGFAARDKGPATLQTVAALCRWIENEHSVPQAWPNGFVRWSHAGTDPGGHNRNAMNWDQTAGHYGHSQVPENTHWDPGYTPAETGIVTPEAVTADALLAQVHLLTGSPAPPPPTPASSSDLHSMVQKVVEGVHASLAQPSTSSFPDGVHTIEVEASNTAERLHVRVSGSPPGESTRSSRRAPAMPRRKRR
jgi:hypothetical protein